MLDRNLIQLQRAIVMCLAKDDFRVVFFVSSEISRKAIMEFVLYDKNFLGVVKHAAGVIEFSNGSSIIISPVEQCTGIEANVVCIDECIDMDVEQIKKLRMRARRK